MDYWQSCCPLSGITDTALLRASHIIPWSECDSDAERLDIRNGLLLSALWDAAFDRALVSFYDDGKPKFSPTLSEAARAELRWQSPIPLTDQNQSPSRPTSQTPPHAFDRMLINPSTPSSAQRLAAHRRIVYVSFQAWHLQKLSHVRSLARDRYIQRRNTRAPQKWSRNDLWW